MRVSNWDSDREAVIKETILTQKPVPASFAVAVASILVLLTASILYWADVFGVADLLPASRESVFFRGEYWRLFTSMLVHADFGHFLSNGVVFGVLAFLLYGYYGPAVYPLGTAVLGMIATGVSLRTYPAQTRLLGASGLVYLMAGFWLTLYLLVERRIAPGKRVVRAVGFGLIVLVPTAIEPMVSYRTHLIGFIFGVLFAMAFFARRKESLRAAERVELE